VISRGETAECQALLLTRLARQEGLIAERDASGAAFAKQFKRADRSGAPWAAVIGDEEAAGGMAKLKDLRGEQPERRLPLGQLVALLRERQMAAARQS
jgi:histidyl-tRNA synthetase